MQAALAKVDGVNDVKVDFSKGEAVVSVATGKTVSDEALLKALSSTKFKETTVKKN